MPFLHFLEPIIRVQVYLVGETPADVIDLLDLAIDGFNELLFVSIVEGHTKIKYND